MSGDATFAGTSYQGRVIAFVYAHILAEARLGWLETADDTPVAVSGETLGPGDDAHIEFGHSRQVIEVQAKHGLTGGRKLDEAIEKIVGVESSLEVVLASDRSASQRLFTQIGPHLDRVRSGRNDGLCTEVERLVAKYKAELTRIHLKQVCVDATNDPEWQTALRWVASVLEKPEEAGAAMAILAHDANTLCAQKLRRTRADLVGLLRANKIIVRPPAKDERWQRELDFTRSLIVDYLTEAALATFDRREAELARSDASGATKHRFYAQRALALLVLGRPDEALAAARQAIEHDSTAVLGHWVAGLAALTKNKATLAQHFAKSAIAADPVHGPSRVLAAHIATRMGQPEPEVPAAARATFEYQLHLGERALHRRDWDEAQKIAVELINTGRNDPPVVILRAKALAEMIDSSNAPLNTERCKQLERVASELIKSVHDRHPQAVEALVLRARAFSIQGRNEESRADLETAAQRQPNDLDVIQRLVIAFDSVGNREAVLKVLQYPAVDRDLRLRAFRVMALADEQDPSARQELEATIELVSNVSSPLELLAVADAALALGDISTASAFIERAQPAIGFEGPLHCVRGRLALARGDWSAATENFHQAATAAPTGRVLHLTELAQRLHLAGREKEAVAAFDELTLEQLSPKALEIYLRALFAIPEYGRAEGVINRLAQMGPLTTGVLQIAINITFLKGDANGAINYLNTLIQAGGDTAQARLGLALALLDAGHQEEATAQLQTITQSELTANEQVHLALSLSKVGLVREAIQVAFDALRREPTLADAHRTFAHVMFSAGDESRPVSSVEVNSLVRLRSSNGEQWSFSIVETATPLQDEMSLASATSLPLNSVEMERGM